MPSGAAFREKYGPWAVIAGGSDGIGEAFARGCASRGLHLVLLARREAPLRELSATLREETGVDVRPVSVDLTSDALMPTVAAATDDIEVGLLVYNAGAVHGAQPLLDAPVEHALGLVDLNCRGPLQLTHHFAGPMRARGRGGVILMTSMAGLVGSAYTTAYAATKSFDWILAEGLWHELAPHGVDVMACVAGATRTPSVLRSSDAFERYPGIMEPAEVAEGALDQLGVGPAWIAGDANRQAAAGLRAAPRVGAINAMSAAAAQIYDLPHTPSEGKDWSELD